MLPQAVLRIALLHASCVLEGEGRAIGRLVCSYLTLSGAHGSYGIQNSGIHTEPWSRRRTSPLRALLASETPTGLSALGARGTGGRATTDVVTARDLKPL